MTCGACPEQYDVYLGEHNVGYLRLRHGFFYAQATDDGYVVYEARPEDSDGVFSEEDREEHLPKAIDTLIAYYLNEGRIELNPHDGGFHYIKN